VSIGTTTRALMRASGHACDARRRRARSRLAATVLFATLVAMFCFSPAALAAPGVTITETGTTEVFENGVGDSYEIVLDEAPAADVVIDIVSDGQVTALPMQLTFTPADWNVPQFVLVDAVNDAIAENLHTGSLSHLTSSADGAWAGLPVAGVTVSITDDDVPNVLVTGGSPDVTEGAAGETYALQLTTEPTGPVTVDIDGGGEVGVAPASVVFTPANWNIAQNITVTAYDDPVIEGPHFALISQVASSPDLTYDGLAVASVLANITDNDAAGLTVTETGGSTQAEEGLGPDSYQVALTARPTGDVTITFDGGDDLTVFPATLDFTAGDWNVPQNVMVQAFDDNIAEGPEAHVVAHAVTSPDDDFDGIGVTDVAVPVVDNDSAAVMIVPSGGTTNVAEGGGADSYGVVLTSEPTAPVTVTIGTDGQSTPSPGTVLTFDATNWFVAKTVTVNAADDFIDEDGPHPSVLTHTVTSGDLVYHGIFAADVPITVADNDIASVVLSESGVDTSVVEGGTGDELFLQLDTQPTAPVTIDLTDLTGELTFSPSTVVFTPANWSLPQEIGVAAIDDPDYESTHSGWIDFTVTSGDPAYQGWSIPQIVVPITELDYPEIIVTPTGPTTDVNEGGAQDTYDIVLTTRPSAPVTVELTGDAQAVAMPGTITFTAANWNVARTVTVAATADDIAEGTHSSAIAHDVTSGDAYYHAMMVADMPVTILDDDVNGVLFAQTGGTTNVTETGDTDTYSVRLSSEPLAAVTVTLTNTAQATAAPSPLTFTAANWNMPQLVTVSAIDDQTVEGAHTTQLGATTTSADPLYQALTVAAVTVNIADNDTAGVTVTQTGGTTSVTEDGATDSYSLALAARPTQDVTIVISTDGQTYATPSVVTFTPGDWNTPQDITVHATDDDLSESSPHPGALMHLVSSGQAQYSGLSVPNVGAGIGDNDDAGVALVQTGGKTQVKEGGKKDTLTVRLFSQPRSKVEFIIDLQEDLTSTKLTLSVDPADWDEDHVITVAARDDTQVEGPHTARVELEVNSADLDYDDYSLNGTDVSIQDNDKRDGSGSDGGSGKVDVPDGAPSGFKETTMGGSGNGGDKGTSTEGDAGAAGNDGAETGAAGGGADGSSGDGGGGEAQSDQGGDSPAGPAPAADADVPLEELQAAAPARKSRPADSASPLTAASAWASDNKGMLAGILAPITFLMALIATMIRGRSAAGAQPAGPTAAGLDARRRAKDAKAAQKLRQAEQKAARKEQTQLVKERRAATKVQMAERKAEQKRAQAERKAQMKQRKGK
jgi:large repetitive protein